MFVYQRVRGKWPKDSLNFDAYIFGMMDCPQIHSASTGVKSAPWRKTLCFGGTKLQEAYRWDLLKIHLLYVIYNIEYDIYIYIYMDYPQLIIDCLWLFVCIWHAHKKNESITRYHAWRKWITMHRQWWRIKQQIWDALSATNQQLEAVGQ